MKPIRIDCRVSAAAVSPVGAPGGVRSTTSGSVAEPMRGGRLALATTLYGAVRPASVSVIDHDVPVTVAACGAPPSTEMATVAPETDTVPVSGKVRFEPATVPSPPPTVPSAAEPVKFTAMSARLTTQLADMPTLPTPSVARPTIVLAPGCTVASTSPPGAVTGRVTVALPLVTSSSRIIASGAVRRIRTCTPAAVAS